MAKEIAVILKLNVANVFGLSKEENYKVDMAGTAFANFVQNIGTSYEQVVVPAAISTAGYAFFKNLDATNYVEVGLQVSSAFQTFMKLKPGESGVLRLATTSFFARAHTAAVNLEIGMLQD